VVVVVMVVVVLVMVVLVVVVVNLENIMGSYNALRAELVGAETRTRDQNSLMQD
jgi:hypothetical protein